VNETASDIHSRSIRAGEGMHVRDQHVGGAHRPRKAKVTWPRKEDLTFEIRSGRAEGP
jgi:hypothetical protein